MERDKLFTYILGIADNSLILGQRMGELCGHGPSLETDIACTNISLDLLGQTRSYYQYAAKLTNDDNADEDTISFLRKEHEYKNALLVEQPNTDFAHIMVKLFFFSAFYLDFLDALQNSHDVQLAAIAHKSLKEVKYHYKLSSDWVCRLGDGTEESHKRTQNAVNWLWPYTNELFEETDVDKLAINKKIGVNLTSLRKVFMDKVNNVLETATLELPEGKWAHSGGKRGVHSEHMGYILSDLQYMQRIYPNMQW